MDVSSGFCSSLDDVAAFLRGFRAFHGPRWAEGYYWLMQQRHPELAQKMRSAGLEKRILKEQMPHHVGAPSVNAQRSFLFGSTNGL